MGGIPLFLRRTFQCFIPPHSDPAEKGLSDLAAHYLMKEGISAIRRVRKTDNNRIARACGATIVSRPGGCALGGQAGGAEPWQAGRRHLPCPATVTLGSPPWLLASGCATHTASRGRAVWLAAAVQQALPWTPSGTPSVPAPPHSVTAPLHLTTAAPAEPLQTKPGRATSALGRGCLRCGRLARSSSPSSWTAR